MAALGGLLLLGCGGTEAGQVLPPAPLIKSFAPAQNPVTSGTGTTLTAVFTGATASISPDVGPVASGTQMAVGPLAADTAFTLVVQGGDAGTSATQTVTVRVVPPPATPVIMLPAGTLDAEASGCTASVPLQDATTYHWTIAGGTPTGGENTAQVTFTAGDPGLLQLECVAVNQASPATIQPGSASQLAWNVTGTTQVTISPDIGTVAASGTAQVTPSATTTYTITAGAPGSPGTGSITASAQVAVAQPPPAITSFTASPPQVLAGQATLLSWTVTGADSVSLAPGIGQVGAGSSILVWPTGSTRYVLTATGPAGSAEAAATVEVVSPGPSGPRR
ncbi:MAG: hypothetical protein ABSH53_21740 [Holophaga sp.]|jgi:hypothetical protein